MNEVFIDTAANQKLAAYIWEPGANDKYMVVVCHGFRGTKENGGKIFGFAEKIRDIGMGILAFDFRGSGQSDGDFSQVTLTRQGEDVQAVIDYVQRQFSLPSILLGRSMGGSSVLAGGSGDQRVEGFVLWSTPVFMRQAFATMIPEEYMLLSQGIRVQITDDAGTFYLDPGLVSDFDRHDMDKYLRNVGQKPVLIVHSYDDESVNPYNAEYLQQNLPNSSLKMFDKAGHRFLECISRREDITIDWLTRIFNK